MRALSLMLLACVSCDPALVAQLDMVTASDLAGTYTGVLEGVSVSTLDDPTLRILQQRKPLVPARRLPGVW